MNLSVLDIPEKPAELAAWLEGQIVGLHLLDTVAVLETFRTTACSAQNPSLDTVLGGRMTDVLAQGLSVLGPGVLRQLLAHPRLLLELQDQVLHNGGSVWFSRPLAFEHQQAVDRGLTSLHSPLGFERHPVAHTAIRSTTGRFTRRWLLAGIVAAAALVMAVVLLPERGWGWDTPGALTATLEAKPYLQRLADLAEEYFAQPRDSRPDLSRTLRDFRHACDTLIAAPHPQLPAAERTLLRELCQKWAAKLEGQITELERTGDVLKVQAASDEIIRVLVKRLRDEAQRVG